MRLAAAAPAAALVALAAAPAAAYQEAGHEHTVAAVVAAAEGGSLNEDWRRALACSQGVDLAREFDAKTLRAHYGLWVPGWTWSSRCESGDVAHMVAVHEYLHALTADSSEKTTHAAMAALAALLAKARQSGAPDDWCAVGFAIHAAGDARSHRVLDDASRMYPPGPGHAEDTYKPDCPLYRDDRIGDARTRVWKEYAVDLGRALDATVDPEKLLQPAVAKALAQGAPDEQNGWDDSALGAALDAASPLRLADKAEAFERAHCKELSWGEKLFHGCELVSSWRDLAAVFPELAGVNFEAAWRAYLAAAVPAFHDLDLRCDPADDPMAKGQAHE